MTIWTQYRRKQEREDYKKSSAIKKLVWMRVLQIYS
jgi:hypothetical protein